MPPGLAKIAGKTTCDAHADPAGKEIVASGASCCWARSEKDRKERITSSWGGPGHGAKSRVARFAGPERGLFLTERKPRRSFWLVQFCPAGLSAGRLFSAALLRSYALENARTLPRGQG